MWLILGGTVGLAALVDNQRSNPQNVPLAPPVAYGFLQIRPPQGWRASRSSGQLVFREEGADPDNETDETGRVLSIAAGPGDLVQGGRVPARKGGPPARPLRDAAVPSRCAGRRASCWRLPEGALWWTDQSGARPGWSVLACTVLPDGLGVTVQLHTPRRPRGRDSRW